MSLIGKRGLLVEPGREGMVFSFFFNCAGGTRSIESRGAQATTEEKEEETCLIEIAV